MRWATFAAALAISAAVAGDAISDEGGVSFWLPGQYAGLAALPPETGFSMPLVTYFYAGDADGEQAFDFGGAYTFLDPKTGWEACATAGVTFNFENPDTDYSSGTSLHLDWAVSRFLSEQLHLGLVGFAYKQISDDSGGLSDQLGGFRSETYGVGPKIGYTFDANGRSVYANL